MALSEGTPESFEVAGYLHPHYADSLEEFGAPQQLPRSGAWILRRQVPGFPYYDAMGCYPLFMCPDWSGLQEDLEDISSQFISLSVVADPCGNYDPNYLKSCFQDMMVPFKQHFIVDLGGEAQNFVSAHHRACAKSALRKVMVLTCGSPVEHIDAWMKLYETLTERHNLKGIARFSRNCFLRQLQVPGLVAFRALFRDEIVGMTLWYVHGDTGYWHLGASSQSGYRLQASFGLLWSAIEYFTAKGLRRLELGGGAGLDGNGDNGLAQFKRGWSTSTRPAYFCGRIFDGERYSAIVKMRDVSGIDYFPAYRKGEYG